MKQQRGTAILLLFMFGIMSFVSGGLDSLVEYATGHQGVIYFIVFYAGLFVLWVMMVNMLGEYIKIYKREHADVGALFSGLRERFWRKLGGALWMMLWVLIWSAVFMGPVLILSYVTMIDSLLLLLIPMSIFIAVKTLAYFFTFNVLADCPNVTATEALKVSVRITHGYKGDVFVFLLSFIGWWLLSVLTLGILYIVYVGPYFYTADAGLYLELKEKALADGKITREELGMTAPPAVHDPIIIN